MKRRDLIKQLEKWAVFLCGTAEVTIGIQTRKPNNRSRFRVIMKLTKI